MCNRVYNYLEKNEIFNENQYAFRRGRSTSSAILKYVNAVLESLNNRQHTVGIFIDLSKAYDRVSHKLLLKKLEIFGIRGIALNWFESFLSGRKQVVETVHHNYETKHMEIIRSQETELHNSIPQGSTLSCLLFLIFINDLPSILPQLMILFADDASILFTCDGLENFESEINKYFKIVVDWITKQGLEINLTKTNVIQFHPYQKVPLKLQIKYNNIILPEVKLLRMLGVFLDSNLNFKPHIEQLNNKLSKFCYALREIRKSTDESTALSTYYGYAYSWLKYGISVWGNAPEVQSVFILQKRCVRIITQTKKPESCRELFKKLKMLTLTSIYILEMCILVHENPKIYQKVGDTHSYPTRQVNLVALPQPNLALYSKGPNYMAITIYNKLPKHMKEYTGRHFVNKLKTFLLDKTFYCINEFLCDS